MKCPICMGEGMRKLYPGDRKMVECDFCNGWGELTQKSKVTDQGGTFEIYGESDEASG